jgi:hypothetical protein
LVEKTLTEPDIRPMKSIAVIFAVQGVWVLVAFLFVLALIGRWLVGRIEHSRHMHELKIAKLTLPPPVASNPAKIARIKAELNDLRRHQ